MAQIIVVTGGAGYVGEMLCEALVARTDVARVVVIDKEPITDFLTALPKIQYVQANVIDLDWEGVIAPHAPTAVIHAAWQIRALYGQSDTQWKWNVEGSNRVFDFAFNQASVQTLVHISTAAVYGATAKNSLEHYFLESEARGDAYIYAREKFVSEQNLSERYAVHQHSSKAVKTVIVLRLAAVTGPRGRYQKIRFGLQSALQGNIKGSVLYRAVTALTAFMPATKYWIRQFVHEDDVVAIIQQFTYSSPKTGYSVFNVTPDSPPVTAPEMARIVRKKLLLVFPWMVRLMFALVWHLTRGRIPTCPGSWRFYSYPILMNGDALKKVYQCQYSAYEAVAYTDGKYADLVPKEFQKTKAEKTVVK